MLQFFCALACTLAVIQYVPYIRDIIRGRTQPERAAWLIWAVLGIVIFSSQLAKGGSWSLGITLVQITGNVTVLALAMRCGRGGLARRDIAALMMAGVGLVLWAVTREPATALLIAVAIDSLGNVLTIMKAIKEPFSETLSTWVMSGLAVTSAGLAVGQWNWLLLAYPVSVAVANATLVGVIVYGRWRAGGRRPVATPC